MADPARAQAQRAARELDDALRSKLNIRAVIATADDLQIIVRIPLASDARELATWIDQGGDECDAPHMDEW